MPVSEEGPESLAPVSAAELSPDELPVSAIVVPVSMAVVPESAVELSPVELSIDAPEPSPLTSASSSGGAAWHTDWMQKPERQS